MKIIREGYMPPPSTPWWVEYVSECARCGTRVELEIGDEVTVSAERHIGGRQVAEFKCPKCDWFMSVERTKP